MANAGGGSARGLVKTSYPWAIAFARISPNGKLYYLGSVRANGGARAMIVPVAGGKPRMLARDAAVLVWSPNSRLLVAVKHSGSDRGGCHTDIYTVRVSGGRATRLTTDHHSAWPAWGPRSIAFSRWRDPTGADEHPTYQGLCLIRA